MMKSVGFIELNSIAKGIEAADAMVKAANVELAFSKPVCPGKFIVLVSGDVGAVESSMSAGVLCGAQHVVDKFILPNVHPQLIPALYGSTHIECTEALGVMEFFSIAASIYSADAAVKAGQVQLIEIRPGVGIGGKSFVTLTGDVSHVEEAVDAGIKDAIECGMLVNYVVIPNPRKEVFANLL